MWRIEQGSLEPSIARDLVCAGFEESEGTKRAGKKEGRKNSYRDVCFYQSLGFLHCLQHVYGIIILSERDITVSMDSNAPTSSTVMHTLYAILYTLALVQLGKVVAYCV